MFTGVSGLMGLGNLINASAVATLKANAYQAAKQVLGPKTKDSILMQASDQYAAFVIPKTNRALSVYEIVHDFNFVRIAKAAKETPDKSMASKFSAIESDFSLGHSLIGGIPNWLLYGGLGYVGYRYYKNKKGGGSTKGGFFKGLFGKKHKTTRHRTSRRRTSLPPPPMIGGIA